VIVTVPKGIRGVQEDLATSIYDQVGFRAVDIVAGFQRAVGFESDAVGAQRIVSAAEQRALHDIPLTGERVGVAGDVQVVREGGVERLEPDCTGAREQGVDLDRTERASSDAAIGIERRRTEDVDLAIDGQHAEALAGILVADVVAGSY